MPDPSGESPDPARPPADAKRPPSSVEPPAHLAPAPRLHPPSLRHIREAAPLSGAPPAALGEVLEWMKIHGAQTGPATANPSPKSTGRAQLPKEQRKFHKFDPEHPGFQALAAEESGPRNPQGLSPDGEEEPPLGDYPGGITAEQLAFIRRYREEKAERTPWISLGLAVVFFLLVAAAFIAGHASWSRLWRAASTPGADSKEPSKVTDRFKGLSAGVQALIDQAAVAEKARLYPQAIEDLERAQHDAEHVYGLHYHLAVLCYKANAVSRVVPLINLSLAEGEEVAACYSFRGALADPFARTDPGPGDLEKATQADPFNARYPFVWGEALRRAGKLDLALVQFRRAADRAQEPELQSAYALKARLTQIELGQTDDLAPEIATQLRLTPPPVAWLLTAAAVEMHRSNFPAAAEHLARVRSQVGATATALHLQDPFFANFAHETELATFFEGPGSVDSPPALVSP